jgi:acyl-CoA synthetase (AMP-forming)/AMP-acid ligase II/pimeloyl-ACP methyl ester carboxylesterase
MEGSVFIEKFIEKETNQPKQSNQNQRKQNPGKSLLDIFARDLQTEPRRVCCYSVSANRDQLIAEPLTYGQLAEQAQCAVEIFREKGAQPGDRIILSLEEPHSFLISFMAALLAGLTAVPVPAVKQFFTPGSLINRIKGVYADCSPRFAVIENKRHWERVMPDLPMELKLLDIGEMKRESQAEQTGPSSITPENAAVLQMAANTIDIKKERQLIKSFAGSRGGFSKEPLAAGGTKSTGTTPAMPAYLQYTSGSTREPRGVIITHGNLAANCEAIGMAARLNPRDVVVSWLPLYHDMGLISGLLIPLYWRIPSYVMSPLTFISRPITWLRAIHRYRGTLSVSPDFGYTLCCRRIPEKVLQGLDLTGWRLALDGSEPINAKSIRDFIQRYRRYGFSPQAFFPVYGLAEATLAVSFPRVGEGLKTDRVDRGVLAAENRAVPVEPGAPTSAEFVSVGTAVPGHELEVIDPATGLQCKERQTGEIVFTGPSVSPGYYGKDEPQPIKRLHTGDLGYIAEGRLYVVDRIKDMIIIAGKNYSPTDIESCIPNIPGTRKNLIIAFSMPNRQGVESLHVGVEVTERTWKQNGDNIRDIIIEEIRRNFSLAVEMVLFIPPGTIKKTTSGKLRRRAFRNLFLTEKTVNIWGGADDMPGELEGYTFKPHYLKLEAGRMHYIDEGRGEPVLMVHGNPTWSYLYRDFIGPLSEHNRVIAPDHLGFGRSQKPPDAAYTLPWHINNLTEAVNRLDLYDISLVVHDWGGPIGLGFAVNHVERIKRLIILNTWAFLLPGNSPLPPLLAQIREPGVGEKLVLEQNALVERGIPGGISRRDRVSAGMMAAYRQPFPTAETRRAMLALVREIPLGKKAPAAETMESIQVGLRKLKIPAIIIWGEKDPVFSPRLVKIWHAYFPGSKAHLLPGVSHFLQEDEPGEILAIMQDFLYGAKPERSLVIPVKINSSLIP